jgi:uncharacterized protein YukJ
MKFGVKNYGVLRGTVINSIPYREGKDHFQIEIQADDIYRIAVDVYSQFAGTKLNFSPDGNTSLDTDRMVMFFKDENFNHPLLYKISLLGKGFTPKASLDNSLCLDYLRTQPPLFPLSSMRVVEPKAMVGQDDNLNSEIEPLVTEALNNPNMEVFAFGSGWDDNAPGAIPDVQPYFQPNPSKGIHDIHMNQGDKGQEAHFNGTFQDGALFFHYIKENKWVGLFFKFQVQSIKTFDHTGNPLPESNYEFNSPQNSFILKPLSL